MDTEKLADAKDAIVNKGKQPLRLKLPIWGWVVIGFGLVIMGAVWFG